MTSLHSETESNMKVAIRICCALLAIALTHSAYATTGTGKVGNILVGRSGTQVYVQLIAPTIVGTWPCASTRPDYTYAFTLTQGGANAMLATLLAAQLSGKSVSVQGANICNQDFAIEDVSYLVLLPA